MLILEIAGLELRRTTSGSLQEWLGPAVRGMVAEPFKRGVCRKPLPPAPQRTPSCSGCEFMTNCPYGRVFEPDPPPGTETTQGRFIAARPVVLSPDFPTPEGRNIPLQATLVGPAIAHADELLKWLDLAGVQRGLGPKRKRLPVQLGEGADFKQTLSKVQPSDLPDRMQSGVVPVVRIELTTPLRLLGLRDKKRQLIPNPTFRDFFDSAFRVIGHLFALFDRPLHVDDRPFAEDADSVIAVETSFSDFEQAIESNKGRQRHKFQGITGWAVFANVPVCFLPWLVWGGRLHVGDRRVAGCGGWRISLG